MDKKNIKVGEDQNKNPEDFSSLKQRDVDPGEVHAIIQALKDQGTDDAAIPNVLVNMGIPKPQAEALTSDFLNKQSQKQQDQQVHQAPPQAQQVYQAPPQSQQQNADYRKEQLAREHNISAEHIGDFFEAPTEKIELPSKGLWYPNKKSHVTIKHLTATEDDILYDYALIRQNNQLNAILESAIVDRDIRPKDLLTCDRDYVLIQLRRTGLGDEYNPGVMACNSCGHIHDPVVDLSKLKTKPIKHHPDENGEFTMEMQTLKATIKFRLLNGHDEMRINNTAMQNKHRGEFSFKGALTEKYILHIMEVNGKRDKIYIKSYVEAMPMKDSKAFREKLKELEPGILMEYDYTCPNCGHIETKPLVINHKLFYPDSDL